MGVDHEAGLTLDHSLRCAPRTAGDHRQTGERRLGVDDAEALDLEPAEPGPRGAGEDVGRLQPEAQLAGRDLAGQDDAVGEAGGGGPAAQLVGQTAAADQGEARVGKRPVEAGERRDQHVLPLARHQAPDAHHKRRVVEAERGAGRQRRRRPG